MKKQKQLRILERIMATILVLNTIALVVVVLGGWHLKN